VQKPLNFNDGRSKRYRGIIGYRESDSLYPTSVEGERFRKGGVMSYLRIGKCLFARFEMLPATYVLTRVYYVSSTVAMVRSGHFFPLGFSPSRRRTVSIDDSIFYLVT
jgi:hypothetical protein